MIYALLILILILYLYFGLLQKQEHFIRYTKENDNMKAVGIDFSNYNIYYEKIVSGVKLTGSFNINGEIITFDSSGTPSKSMTLEQLKKTSESINECAGFIILDDNSDSQARNSMFLKSVTELQSDPLSLEKNLSDEQKKVYKNELTNYPKNTSFIKKFINRVKEQNMADLQDNRQLFSKNECAIIDDGKNDIIQFKGTLDECKAKCASYNNCQVFNRGKDAFDSNSSECILKKTYQNKYGLCVPNDKYISYSRGGQIKYEIWEIKENERIERERIEKERREREERERKERERIEKERREREERERREREERERREREEREKREREERERIARERQFYKNWVNSYKSSSTLLYRASSHGWNVDNFHSYCDNRGPTITVCYINDGRIVGGYNSNSWQRNTCQYVHSNNNLLFDDNDKYTIVSGWQNYASVNCWAYPPTFGAGHDLYVYLPNKYVYITPHSFKNNYGQGISIGHQHLRDVEIYSVNASWFN